MYSLKSFSLSTLIVALLIPLLVGGISAALSSRAMIAYGSMNKAPLSPPAWVFSVAWTILYIVMGLASYYVIMMESDPRIKAVALGIYALQLAMNFMWSLIFFNWRMYLVAFIWLMIMWCLVIVCAFRFYSISKIAGIMMIPYILWLTFAAYLNFGTYWLNMDGTW